MTAMQTPRSIASFMQVSCKFHLRRRIVTDEKRPRIVARLLRMKRGPAHKIQAGTSTRRRCAPRRPSSPSELRACQRTRAATPPSLRAGGGSCWEHAHMEPTAPVDPSTLPSLAKLLLGPLPGMGAKAKEGPRRGLVLWQCTLHGLWRWNFRSAPRRDGSHSIPTWAVGGQY